MLKSIRLLSVTLFASLIPALMTSNAQALTPTSEYQLKLLTQGGPESIRSTAESIYNSGYSELEVTDTMAEILLQNYTRNDRQYTDALAWSAKALGSTHNSRYRNTLAEVLAQSSDRKLNKYVEASLKLLPQTQTEQYVKGTINLNAARTQTSEAKPATASIPPPGAAGTNKITAAMPGMSMEEVNAYAVHPQRLPRISRAKHLFLLTLEAKVM